MLTNPLTKLCSRLHYTCKYSCLTTLASKEMNFGLYSSAPHVEKNPTKWDCYFTPVTFNTNLKSEAPLVRICKVPGDVDAGASLQGCPLRSCSKTLNLSMTMICAAMVSNQIFEILSRTLFLLCCVCFNSLQFVQLPKSWSRCCHQNNWLFNWPTDCHNAIIGCRG